MKRVSELDDAIAWVNEDEYISTAQGLEDLDGIYPSLLEHKWTPLQTRAAWAAGITADAITEAITGKPTDQAVEAVLALLQDEDRWPSPLDWRRPSE